jgi:hypothetical protein
MTEDTQNTDEQTADPAVVAQDEFAADPATDPVVDETAAQDLSLAPDAPEAFEAAPETGHPRGSTAHGRQGIQAFPARHPRT